MKNSVKIKDTISTQIIKNSQMLSVKNEGYSKAKRIIDIAHKTLAVSLVLAVNVGFSAVSGSGQAKAAGLADLFNDAEVQGGEQKFLKVEQAFNVQPSQSSNKINIALKITPKYYLYKDKLTLKLPDGVTASAIKFSQPSQTIDDPSFGKVNVFKQPQLTATTTLTNTTATAINQDVTISWQGCAEAGLCYPPQKETLSISLPAGSTNAVEPKQNTTKTSKTNQVEQTPNDVKTNNASKLAANESQVKAVTASSSDNNLTQSGQQQGQIDTSAITVSDDSIDEGSLAKSDSLIDNDKAQSNTELDTLQDQDQDQASANAIEEDTNSSVISNDSGLQLGSHSAVDQDPFGLAKHPWLALMLLFLAGLGLAFTPCVLPMLPIVSNIVARQNNPTAKKGLILSGSYALGVATAYGILGAVIAVFGQQLGIIGWLQNPIILSAFAAIFVLLALYMLEVINIPVPKALRQKTHSLSQAGDKYLGSTFGSFIAGLLSALVVSPCVSAPLFGALLAVSTIGNPLLGFAALFMLGFGLSAPLILLGISQGNLMPKAGEWMTWVKQGFALMLFAVALLLIERVLTSPIMLMLWSMWFMVVAVWAWKWIGRGQLFTKPLAIVFAAWSVLTLVGAAAGSEDSWQPLSIFSQSNAISINDKLQAVGAQTMASNVLYEDKHIDTLDALIPIINQNSKVLVDVTADWCVECRIMDKTLFANRPATMQQWQLVKLDVTDSNAESARILSELSLFGPPALLYFVDGKLKVQQVGAVKRSDFESTLNRF